MSDSICAKHARKRCGRSCRLLEDRLSTSSTECQQHQSQIPRCRRWTKYWHATHRNLPEMITTRLVVKVRRTSPVTPFHFGGRGESQIHVAVCSALAKVKLFQIRITTWTHNTNHRQCIYVHSLNAVHRKNNLHFGPPKARSCRRPRGRK